MDVCTFAPQDVIDLESVITTAELSRRPSRSLNHESENRALVALAQEMANSPDGILQKLVDAALDLCRAHSAGLSVLEEDRKRFRWRAIAGQWASHLGGGTPRDFGPCGTVLDRNMTLLFAHPERHFPYLAQVMPYQTTSTSSPCCLASSTRACSGDTRAPFFGFGPRLPGGAGAGKA